MICKELGIKPCHVCLGYTHPFIKGSEGFNTCAVLNHKARLEGSGDIRKHILSWVKFRRIDNTYFKAALRKFYPEYLITYEKLLILT